MPENTALTLQLPVRPPWTSGLTYFDEDAYTGLDLESIAGRKDFVRAQQQDPEPSEKYFNQDIEVCNFLVHPAQKTNPDTGVTERWARQVLFLKNGTMLAFGSEGIEKSIRMAIMMFKLPPWKGLKGRLTQTSIGDKKRWIQVEWDLTQMMPGPEESGQQPGASATSKRGR